MLTKVYSFRGVFLVVTVLQGCSGIKQMKLGVMVPVAAHPKKFKVCLLHT